MADSLDSNLQSVRISKIGVILQLTPTENFFTDEVIAELNTAFADCIEHKDYKIVIDLSFVKFINSKAIEYLLEKNDLLLQHGGSLKVAKASQLVGCIFKITGFYENVRALDNHNDTDQLSITDEQYKGKLGDVLVGLEKISQEQLEEALILQRTAGKKLGEILLEKQWVSENDIFTILSAQIGVPYVHLQNGIYDPDVVKLLDKNIVKRLNVMPLFMIRGELTLATSDPHSLPIMNEVSERLSCKIRPVLTHLNEIRKHLSEAYDLSEFTAELITEVDADFEVVEATTPDNYQAIDEMAEESPVINLVNSIIQRAVRSGASDIHIEPGRDKFRVRCRVDGILYETMSLQMELHPAIVSRLKVMSNLDIAERRMPQDGRIQVQTQGHLVDLRFSSLPGLWGEKVVLRILDKEKAILDINKLGMLNDNLSTFKRLLTHTHGLILVTGPTGSGKTTSLYAALSYMNSLEKNIVTIEDPIEYQLDIINQNQIKQDLGLDFAKMLKHVLRQDPDIVMVGEIREPETAHIAIQAALTGHLVLSTLHTNDSVSAVTRLIDMGIEPYLLSSALIGVIGQRLVRTICSSCKTYSVAQHEIVERYHWEEHGLVRLAKGRGCEECHDSGYKGRLCIHEILTMESDLQRLIATVPTRDELESYLDSVNFKSMYFNGLEQVRQGVTTFEEIGRIIHS